MQAALSGGIGTGAGDASDDVEALKRRLSLLSTKYVKERRSSMALTGQVESLHGTIDRLQQELDAKARAMAAHAKHLKQLETAKVGFLFGAETARGAQSCLCCCVGNRFLHATCGGWGLGADTKADCLALGDCPVPVSDGWLCGAYCLDIFGGCVVSSLARGFLCFCRTRYECKSV